MPQSDNKSTDQKQVEQAFSWLGDHGTLNYEKLKNLAESGTPEDLEQLHQLADDNNISYDTSTSPMLLMEEIRNAMEIDDNVGVE